MSNTVIQAAFAGAAGLGLMSVVTAANLVVSGIGDVASERVVLTDATGTPLADGCRVEVVDFGTWTENAIAEAAGEGELAGVGTPFGPPMAVGDGSTSVAGTMEVVARVDLSEDSGVLHLVVWNGPVASEATEVLVLRLPGEVPADDESGLPGYHAVHLLDATVVYGSITESGYATASAGGVDRFAEWMSAELPPGHSPEDFEADGDPDGDGSSNFLEYALGSRAADPASIAAIAIDLREDGAFVRYLRRSDDPTLVYQAEFTGDPAGTWEVVAGEETATIDPPGAAPPGYGWWERALPAVPDRLLVRLRIE